MQLMDGEEVSMAASSEQGMNEQVQAERSVWGADCISSCGTLEEWLPINTARCRAPGGLRVENDIL